MFPPKSETPKETCGWQIPTNTLNFYPKKQNSKKSGRPPKAEPTTFRCSVNFTAAEEAKLMTMHEQSDISSLHAHYRTICVEYSNLIHLLRQNFSEKKALTALYKLEKVTIDLVKTNREITALSKEFDCRWRAKDGS